MNIVVAAIAGVAFILWLPQALLVAGYVLRLRRWQVPLIDDDSAPEALVVLCLRGGDPFLARCIDGLVTQAYPRYRVRFVVDHPQDPSLSILNAALAMHNFQAFEIVFLQDPRTTCSLKCSGLAQAVETDPIYQDTGGSGPHSEPFVAILDADTIPHPTWLRQLATALRDPKVGAATGNRWYIPDSPSSAALVRRSWNAAAIVQMYFYRIAWGGTLALKVSSIRAAQLLDRWRQALCEDTMTESQLKRIGQRIAFVPGLLMVNREDCNFAGLVPWMRRQLLTTRFYHPSWPAVVFHGLSTALFLLWGWGQTVAYLLAGQLELAACTAIVMSIYQVCLVALLLPLSSAVQTIIRARGESIEPAIKASWFSSVLAVIVTQWVYTYALVTCILARQVNWRGIHYLTPSAWQIHMVEYRPYENAAAETVESL